MSYFSMLYSSRVIGVGKPSVERCLRGPGHRSVATWSPRRAATRTLLVQARGERTGESYGSKNLCCEHSSRMGHPGALIKPCQKKTPIVWVSTFGPNTSPPNELYFIILGYRQGYSKDATPGPGPKRYSNCKVAFKTGEEFTGWFGAPSCAPNRAFEN